MRAGFLSGNLARLDLSWISMATTLYHLGCSNLVVSCMLARAASCPCMLWTVNLQHSLWLHYNRARGFSLPGEQLDFDFNKTCMTRSESLCNDSNTTPTIWILVIVSNTNRSLSPLILYCCCGSDQLSLIWLIAWIVYSGSNNTFSIRTMFNSNTSLLVICNEPSAITTESCLTIQMLLLYLNQVY